MATVYMLTMQDSPTSEVNYSEMRRLFEQEKVESFKIEGDEVIMELREEHEGSKTVTHKLYNVYRYTV